MMQIKDVRSAKTFACESCGNLVLSGDTYISMKVLKIDKVVLLRKLCLACAEERGYWDSVKNKPVYRNTYCKGTLKRQL